VHPFGGRSEQKAVIADASGCVISSTSIVADSTPAREREGLAVGTTVLVLESIIREILNAETARSWRAQRRPLRKVWIAATELRIWDEGGEPLLLQQIAAVRLGEVVGVGQEGCSAESALEDPGLLGGVKAGF
jgi:hypothetical protein